MASKNNEKWMANSEALKAYINEHHHLPPKNAPLGGEISPNFRQIRQAYNKGGDL